MVANAGDVAHFVEVVLVVEHRLLGGAPALDQDACQVGQPAAVIAAVDCFDGVFAWGVRVADANPLARAEHVVAGLVDEDLIVKERIRGGRGALHVFEESTIVESIDERRAVGVGLSPDSVEVVGEAGFVSVGALGERDPLVGVDLTRRPGRAATLSRRQ